MVHGHDKFYIAPGTDIEFRLRKYYTFYEILR